MRKSRPLAQGLPSLWLSWLRLGTKTAEMLASSACVISARTQQLAATTPPRRGQDAQEATRMVTEKVAAAAESTMAMSQAILTMQTRMAGRFLKAALSGGVASSRRPEAVAKAARTTATQAASDMVRCAEAGLEPVRKRAVANRKRLARKKR